MTLAKPQHELLNPPAPKELLNPPKPKQEVKKSQKPLSRLLNRVLLFGAGAGLLAWGISLMTNRVTLVTAKNAFVNGKIITVTSPISGKIQSKIELESGTPVRSKQVLLNVNEPLVNSDWLQNIKLDLIAEQAKLDSIDAKISQLVRSGKATLPNRNQQQTTPRSPERETYKSQEVTFTRPDSETAQTSGKVAIRLAEQNVKQAEIDLKVAQNHAEVAHSKYEKFRFLAKQGAMSSFSVEEVLNNWRVSLEQVEAAKVRLETAKIHLAEQRRLHSQASTLRVNPVAIKTITEKTNIEKTNIEQTHTDSLDSELAELMRRKTDIQISIEAKEKAMAEVEKTSSKQKDYEVLATNKGVLWEVMAHDGEQVTPGQPLLKQLNCQELWVDAFVLLDDLKRIEIGSPAQVELYANDMKLNGRVKTIRSSLSGEPKLGQDVAVNSPDTKNQQLAQVRIELENPQEISNSIESSAQFCQVGQLAKVNIGQGDSLFANLLPW